MENDFNIDDVLNDIPGLVKENESSDPVDQQQAPEAPQAAPEDSEGVQKEQTETPPEPSKTEEPAKPKVDKSAIAFAKLRTELAANKKLIKDIAAALEISSATDETVLMNDIKDKILSIKSEKTKVPAELLKELENLKSVQKEHQMQQRRQRVAADLQQLKTELDVPDSAIADFIQKLVEDGVNPYTHDVNLKLEYLSRYWSTMLEQAIERGRKEEQDRIQRVAQHASTPNKAVGGNAGATSKKVDSQKAFDDFLNSLDINDL